MMTKEAQNGAKKTRVNFVLYFSTKCPNAQWFKPSYTCPLTFRSLWLENYFL